MFKIFKAYIILQIVSIIKDKIYYYSRKQSETAVNIEKVNGGTFAGSISKCLQRTGQIDYEAMNEERKKEHLTYLHQEWQIYNHKITALSEVLTLINKI